MASATTHLFPDTGVAIMSSVLGGIVYGFSVLMFIGTIWIFTYNNRIRNVRVNRPIAAVATLLFLLSTAHTVVGIIQLEVGLAKYRDTFPGAPVSFFADISQILVVKDVIYTLQTLLGDGVVIYRCYVVWPSVWVIVLPCMMWCGVAAIGVCMVYDVSQASTSAGSVKDAERWVVVFLAFTLATNLFSSGLLAYRIWMIERKVSKIRTTKGKKPLLRVLVDSALLYTVSLFPSLICSALSNNGDRIMFDVGDLVVPIISIAFYMVFIRIAISQNNQDHVSVVCGGTTGI
ncbi:hypothetical protein DEU56DRAFT_913944 [Suillus clintonianus]|uniref:uncharacterized protein n=1 Tax=Suillus clintonianus TaxID=1904413 RepID=UPI001B85D219|nr:uncharacterized protein DEU56DRAFT_913944 [Suillus clintonianus]KAG2133336.1 hypothetical protein DEU56DRAFT_913944 [Suillus clintonianus]